jgi:hypothetical protein
VRIRAAEDASRQQARRDQIGGVFRPPRHLVRAVDHRHVGADIVRRHDLVHGETPRSLRSPPPCGEGSGVGVASGDASGAADASLHHPPPQPSPTRGEGAHRASGASLFTARLHSHGARRRISPPR